MNEIGLFRAHALWDSYICIATAYICIATANICIATASYICIATADLRRQIRESP